MGAARVVAVAVALANTAVTAMHDQLDMLTPSDGASASVGFRLGAMTRTGGGGSLALHHPFAAAGHDVNRPAARYGAPTAMGFRFRFRRLRPP